MEKAYPFFECSDKCPERPAVGAVVQFVCRTLRLSRIGVSGDSSLRATIKYKLPALGSHDAKLC